MVATPVAVYRGLREVEGLYASLRERYFDIIENKVTWTCVAGDSVVEEGVMRVSHGGKIEWLLPGVKATEREIVVPTVS